MSLFYISSWLTLKTTRVILQDPIQLTLSLQLQNYKNYTACLETLGHAINCLHNFWKNLFAQVINRLHAKYLLKGLMLFFCFNRGLRKRMTIYWGMVCLMCSFMLATLWTLLMVFLTNLQKLKVTVTFFIYILLSNTCQWLFS